MVNIVSFEDSFYYPPEFEGLETLVRFPDGEFKRKEIPNSIVWVFSPENHKFRREILGNDIGCGMTAFIVGEIDPKEAADKFYKFLKGKQILNGNQFVDVCSGIESYFDREEQRYNILFLHTHGNKDNKAESVKEAKKITEETAIFRENLGYDLANLLRCSCKLLGDWPHNTVEQEDGKIIYRKGVIKVRPSKLHFLPAHLGAKIWVYTIDEKRLPPYSSMPHATGRNGPIGKKKVNLEEAAFLRKLVYIPEEISNSSLRSEHPSCFNNFDKIIEKLGGGAEIKYILSVGEVRILSYVGNV